MSQHNDRSFLWLISALVGAAHREILALRRSVKPKSIAKQLKLVAGSVLAAITTMALVSIHFAQVAQETADYVHQQGVAELVRATDLEVALTQHRRIVESAPAEVDRATIALHRENLLAVRDRLTDLMDGIGTTLPHDARIDLHKNLLMVELFALGDQVLFFAENFAQDQALTTVAAYLVIAVQLQYRIAQYRGGRIQVAQDAAARMSSEVRSFIWRILGCVSFSFLVLGPLSLLILRSLIFRLTEIKDVTLKLADGDRSVVVYSAADEDEIGDVARAVDIFKGNAISLANSQFDLEQTNAKFSVALEHMSQGLCMFDENTRVVVSNRRYCEIYDLAPDSIQPGDTLEDVIQKRIANGAYPHGKRQSYLQERMAQSTTLDHQLDELSNGRVVSIRRRKMRGGGWVTTHDDVTELHRAEALTKHQANHDSLTDLANRVRLHSSIETCISALVQEQKFALLCLDLDHFKDVNDTYGHSIGDQLLLRVADRLRACVRPTDLVARTGGDEFTILQVGVKSQSDSVALAQRLIQRLSEPFVISGHECVIGVSIGIAIAPEHGSSVEDIARRGDFALYCVKEAGRGDFRVFEPSMELARSNRLSVATDMRDAMARGEMHLVYQPIIDLRSQKIHSFEALLRWQHPIRGFVSPMEFIPIAEETGAINEIGAWVLNAATREAASWVHSAGIAVNLSPVQFKQGNIAKIVIDALNASGLEPHRLELEITESLLLQNNKGTFEALHELRELGVRFALDDFGTGYSSLSYLKSFPFDKIKIDRSFVSHLDTRVDSCAIVQSIAALAKSLAIETVAEGVERPEELALVESSGCTHVQGYLLSRPVRADQIADLHVTCAPLKLKAA